MLETLPLLVVMEVAAVVAAGVTPWLCVVRLSLVVRALKLRVSVVCALEMEGPALCPPPLLPLLFLLLPRAHQTVRQCPWKA